MRRPRFGVGTLVAGMALGAVLTVMLGTVSQPLPIDPPFRDVPTIWSLIDYKRSADAVAERDRQLASATRFPPVVTSLPSGSVALVIDSVGYGWMVNSNGVARAVGTNDSNVPTYIINFRAPTLSGGRDHISLEHSIGYAVYRETVAKDTAAREAEAAKKTPGETP